MTPCSSCEVEGEGRRRCWGGWGELEIMKRRRRIKRRRIKEGEDEE